MVLSPAGTGSQPASELCFQSPGAEDFGAETNGWMGIIIRVHTWLWRYMITVKTGFSLDVFSLLEQGEPLRHDSNDGNESAG